MDVSYRTELPCIMRPKQVTSPGIRASAWLLSQNIDEDDATSSYINRRIHVRICLSMCAEAPRVATDRCMQV